MRIHDARRRMALTRLAPSFTLALPMSSSSMARPEGRRVIAAEIVEDLRAALEQFEAVEADSSRS